MRLASGEVRTTPVSAAPMCRSWARIMCMQIDNDRDRGGPCRTTHPGRLLGDSDERHGRRTRQVLAPAIVSRQSERASKDDPATAPKLSYGQRQSVVEVNRVFLIGAVAFVVIWSASVIAAGAWFLAPIAAVMVLVLVLSVWLRRTARLGVTVDGEHLIVTNLLRVHRIDRDEILGFVIEPGLLGSKPTFEIKLKDFTSINCDVMGPRRGAPTRLDIDACQAGLSAWLRGSR